MFNLFNLFNSYVLVNIVGMGLQQNLLCKNIMVYDLCIDIRLQDHKCFQMHMDLDNGNQYKLDDSYSQYLKHTLVDIHSLDLQQNWVDTCKLVYDFEFYTLY